MREVAEEVEDEAAQAPRAKSPACISPAPANSRREEAPLGRSSHMYRITTTAGASKSTFSSGLNYKLGLI